MKLRAEQLALADEMMSRDEGIVQGDTGVGKTVVMLEVARRRAAAGLGRTYIVTVLKAAQTAFPQDAAKLGLEIGVAVGNEKQRRAVIDGDSEIVVLSFSNLIWFLDEYGGGHAWIIDELTKLKAGKAANKFVRLGRDSTYRWGLTATPVAESGADLYQMVKCIDRGRRLGKRKDVFLMQYFTCWDGFSWEIKPGAELLIAEAVKDLVVVLEGDTRNIEAVTVDVPVEMDGPSWDLYREMQQKWYLEAQDVESVNSAVLANKLLMMAAGGLYRGEETIDIHGAKEAALVDLVADLGQVVVVYQYIFQKERLLRLFPDAVVFADDPQGAIAHLRAGGKMVILHSQSGGHGVDGLQVARDLVHLTPPWSNDQYKQTLGRLRRHGQEQTVRRWMLVVPGTADEVVLDKLAGKELDEQRMMDALCGRD